MTGPADPTGGPVADSPVTPEVLSSDVRYRSGRVIGVRTDVVRLPGGDEVTRDVVVHPGAVGVIALDDRGRVLLVRQYRHPARHALWEPPAGLLDHPGEDPLTAAARELVEEAGQQARSWAVLVDAFTSPGMTDEVLRIYLARELTAVDRPPGEAEERDMPIAWVALDEAARVVLLGGLHNPIAIMGIMSAMAASRSGFSGLRAADAPWPARAAAKSTY